MAVELIEENGGRVVTIRVNGRLSRSDYKRFVPEVERLIRQHGQVRILFEMYDFYGWKTGALWEDVKFDVRHFGDIERLAVVGEKRWQKGMAVFCRPFTGAKIRYFDHSQADAARAWVEEELAVPAH